MNFKLSFSKLFSTLLAFFLVISFQMNANAQITVFNFSGCDMIVTVAQNDYSTAIPCDLCPVNPPQTVFIPNGQSQVIFGQDVCEEQWGWVRWRTTFSLATGLSNNPGVGPACGPNIPGPFCAANLPTQAFWLSTNVLGTGPISVFIF